MITKEELKKYQIAYSQGNPIISDEEYDRLLEEYLNEHGEENRPFLRTKQSDSVNDIVGTLPKVYGVTTAMRDGQKTYERWMYLNVEDKRSVIIVQPKFDGCSVAYDFKTKRFFTRGDYDNGESIDVTELFRDNIKSDNDIRTLFGLSPKVDIDKFVSAKFEAIMSKEVFESIHPLKSDGSPYKRARDVVSATITSRSVEMAKYITLIPLRLFCNDGICIPLGAFPPFGLWYADCFKGIETFINELLSNQAHQELNHQHYACDGVVVSVSVDDPNDVDENQMSNFYTNDVAYIDPEKEVAIKILNNIKETKLIKVDFQFGKTGRITPVAILQPVMFDNITVDHVTLSTIDRVVGMNLKVNDTVRIVYNIVPYFLESYHDGDYPIQIPHNCPHCGSPFDLKTLKQVRCTNPNCVGLKTGAIIRYCQKMKMFGVSEGIITKLFDEGVIKDIPDLYRMTIEDVSNIPGFGETSAKNIIKSIKDSSTNVSLSRWLGALPLRDTSSKTWDIIIKTNFSGNNFKAVNHITEWFESGDTESFLSRLVFPPGVGILKIQRIAEGLRLHWDEIKETLPYITFDITQSNLPVNIKGKVAMTGTRDEELTKYLNEKGYEVTSFSGKVEALIIPHEGFTSSKVPKAQSLGIPIYTITEAYEKL